VGYERCQIKHPIKKDKGLNIMEQNEKTVIDGTRYHMHVRHLTLRGTNFEIGRELARIGIQRHGRQADRHLRSDPRFVRARRQYIQQAYPIHWQRMRGVAEAFGLDPLDDRYDFSALMYGVDFPQMPPAAMPPLGCSVVYYPPESTASNSAYLSRNFDFSTGSVADLFGIPGGNMEPMVRHPYILELHPSDGGYASIAIQAYDLLSGTLDGMNEAGLVVSIMADEEAMAQIHELHPGPARAVGLHELQVMRYLLDTCATVEEAEAALLLVSQYYQLVPCHYIIGDRQGNSFVYEYSTGRNVQHLLEGNGRPQAVTNFQLHRHPSREAMPGDGFSLETNAFWRYLQLDDQIQRPNSRFSEAEMKTFNSCVSVAEMFRLLGDNPQLQSIAAGSLTRTLWHSLYNVEAGTVAFDFYLGESGQGSDRSEQRSGYHEFSLMPQAENDNASKFKENSDRTAVFA